MVLFKKIALLILILFPVLSVFCQNTSDSLLQQFTKARSEAERAELLRQINKNLEDIEIDIAISYWNTLIGICDASDFDNESGFCHYNKAIRLNNEGEYFKSYLEYTECEKKYISTNNKPGLARAYNGLGNLFRNLNKDKDALTNYQKSAKYFKQLNDSIYGIIFLNMGGILVELDSVKEAKFYLNESKNILSVKNDLSGLINCYINLSEVYLAEYKPDSALHYLLKSYALVSENIELVDEFFATYNLGEFYLNQGNFEKAKPLLYKAFEIAENHAEKYSIPIEARMLAVKSLSDLMEESGNTENAYILLKRYIEYQAQSKREQSNIEISQIAFAEQESKTKREIRVRQTTTYISIAGLLVSILLLFSFYRGYKHKKEANRLLTEMDELKNRLYSNITHELRTPLTLILGPIEQMLSSESEKIPSRKQIKMMRKNANSLLNLVNQMLDLSKIDAKSMKLELIEDDINKFLRTRFAAFASLAEQKSIGYQCSLLNEKNIRIFDSTKLEKIINNLLSNALKFTGNNGTIACYANFHWPNTLELIVQDDGKGIPKNELNAIFERFHQVKSNDEIMNFGTGIGLSLTKELVEIMHGKIVVESELGKGSKFTVTLPLGIEHLSIDEYQIVKHLNHNSLQNENNLDLSDIDCRNNSHQDAGDKNLPHVLIVEDHADIREYIAENLDDSFFTEMADNGKTGLARAIHCIPDLIITDIVMPEMDGIEMCKQLKTDEKTSHIPVIMLTGKSDIEDRLSGLNTGADAYLTKPFNIKELRLRAIKLIELRKSLRERFTRDLRFEPKDIAVTSVDEKFIARAMEIVEQNIGNAEFEVSQFQKEMNMSRMQLFRKIKALTDQTPGDFIRTIRLKRAASLLKQNFGNVAQITYEVGFNNPSYFAKCFKELYGELPSDFVKH